MYIRLCVHALILQLKCISEGNNLFAMFIRLRALALILKLKCISEGNKLCYVLQVVFSGSDTLA